MSDDHSTESIQEHIRVYIMVFGAPDPAGVIREFYTNANTNVS